MRSNWFLLMDLDGGSPYSFPAQPLASCSFGGHLLFQISSFVDNSLNQPRYLYAPGSLALREAFNCISKFAGSLLFWFASGSSSSLRHQLSDNMHKSKSCQSCSQVKHITCKNNLAGLHFGSRSRAQATTPVLFGKIVSSAIRHLGKQIEQIQSFPVLSLAAALVPPFDNLSPNALAFQVENTVVQINEHMDQMPCVGEHQGCVDLSFPQIICQEHTYEPRTGIKFPTVLNNIIAGENSFNVTSEILVGTGSRSIRIMRIKSLKVYAFGLYVQPDSVCEKLGPKYASMPASELNSRPEFFEDLLREDIHMTVRLVVNCNGLKINTVRDVFETSLRTRLLKVNPEADHHCLRMFRSYFMQDIPLPVGTTIDFRQTVDGQLITEIGGKQIGAVHSKDLCRAFFDMYIGDVSVSEHAKQEITRNVASIIRRCQLGLSFRVPSNQGDRVEAAL